MRLVEQAISSAEETNRKLDGLESAVSHLEATVAKLEVQMGIPVRNETDQAARAS